VTIAEIFSRSAAELALFAGVGFLLFAVNDLAVDLIYFARRMWRAIGIYSRHQRAYASYFVFNKNPGLIAVLVPAWDESAVIASMLKAMLRRLDYDNYRIFVGHYRNDPATAAAIASIDDPRIEPVEVPADGPTTKADSTICTMRWSDTSSGTTARPRRSFCTTPRTSCIATNCGSSTD
jgi:adsorption protein B